MTPVLLFYFGVEPTTAIATDLWFAAVTKVVGVRAHHAAGSIDWQVVRRLWLGSLPVALAVVVAVSLGNNVVKVGWLNQAIGIVVIVTAAGMLLAPALQVMARERRLGHPKTFLRYQPLLTVIAGALLGVCVALTSIGAGALGSIMLLYLYPLRMQPHRLVATDILHAIPLSMVAGAGYLLMGKVDGAMLLSLLCGSLPAVWVGSRLAHRFSGRTLQIVLALMLIAVGGKVLFAAFA